MMFGDDYQFVVYIQIRPKRIAYTVRIIGIYDSAMSTSQSLWV